MSSEFYSHRPEQLEAHNLVFATSEQIVSLQEHLKKRALGEAAYDSAQHKLELEDSIIEGLNDRERQQFYNQQIQLRASTEVDPDSDIEALDEAEELIEQAGLDAIDTVERFKPTHITDSQIDMIRIEKFGEYDFLQVITLHKEHPHRQSVAANRPVNFALLQRSDTDWRPPIEPLDITALAQQMEQLRQYYDVLASLDEESFAAWYELLSDKESGP